MRLRPIARVPFVALVVALCAACTSSPGDSSGNDDPASAAPAPATSRSESPVAPSATASADEGPIEIAGGRVALRPPRGGSFRVRGLYPWSPSPCVRPERPSLDGRYPGALLIRTADDGTLTATVTITFQEYLEGIAEVPPTWPEAALEAQVIAARSYVLSRTGWTGAPGEELDSSICGTSDCQVYGGIPQPRPPGLRRWNDAVHDTRGEVLLYGDRPADTLYFSTSNGRTYGNEEVFGSTPVPYLRPVVEEDDGASPLSHWRVELPLDDLTDILRAAGSWSAGAPITSAAVAGSSVRFAGGGQTRTLDAGGLRDAVNTWAPCLMPNRYPSGGLPTTIPSGWFAMSSTRDGLVVDGRGWGHGVGMVQWGAYGKAARGWSAPRILAFYYGGLEPRRIAEPGTMQVVIAIGLRSMTVDPSRPGATIGGHPLGAETLTITGGDELTVSTG